VWGKEKSAQGKERKRTPMYFRGRSNLQKEKQKERGKKGLKVGHSGGGGEIASGGLFEFAMKTKPEKSWGKA